jgi:heat shock protein HslJ
MPFRYFIYKQCKTGFCTLLSCMILILCSGSCQRKSISGADATLSFADPQKVWRLNSINGKSIDSGLPERQIPFIVFSSADNRISGSGGCNRFTGSFRLEANRHMKIGPLAATRMACFNLSDETEFFKALDEVVSYQIRNNELTLLSPDNQVENKSILVFQSIFTANR